ncbi:hypothetical protein AYI68_g3032 [Smittium mucronatum]|uniref:Uncharacterized protein n=1 Tax=Smittium mucronatum TaxID=133383 RepID=A0A1R0H123_9FUNG|nr:hypothetical protein AYI68_g3032 [Smittium mucronatum]
MDENNSIEYCNSVIEEIDSAINNNLEFSKKENYDIINQISEENLVSSNNFFEKKTSNFAKKLSHLVEKIDAIEDIMSQLNLEYQYQGFSLL